MATDNTNTNPIRTLEYDDGKSRCEVHNFGATLLSFRPNGGRECLFVSRDAKLDGSKAVRGGVPLVFPQFGPLPDTSMPQHGFLRQNKWKLVSQSSSSDKEEDAGCSTCSSTMKYTLSLKDDVTAARGTHEWGVEGEMDCICTYLIRIDATKLTTTLRIKNTSSSDKSFPFQTLQHTYLKVDNGAAHDASRCYVRGLREYTVIDKITEEEEYVNEDEQVVLIDDVVDRVYNPPSGTEGVDVTVGVGNDAYAMKLTATGTIEDNDNSTNLPVSCVVWNPHKEKAAGMSDFGNDQYSDMICVEPGVLLHKEPLKPGQSTTLTQTIELIEK